MSKGLDIQIEGIEKALKDLKDKAQGLEVNVDNEMNGFIIDVNAEQKKNCLAAIQTNYNSRLVNGNQFDTSKKLDKLLFNDVEYSPYVEFGTGTLVDVPPGLEEIAIQFKGMGIRKVNLPARPFFFRAFFEQKTKLIENIKRILSQ